MDYRFIESEAELEGVCRDLLAQKTVGVDLEADSMHCFREKICLIQVVSKAGIFLIDPFRIRDVSAFVRVLESPAVTVVFHGADFDIRSLDREYQARVTGLFDTEIACRFLGIRERGLGALLKAFFGVESDKRFQKADWSRRPLNPDMIAYSVGDVAHLLPLREILAGRLAEKGRLSWAKEEFEIQSRVRYEEPHALPLFQAFKGAGRLDRRSLAVLESLLRMRLDLARKKDQPLFKILSNASVMLMAREKPETVEKMLEIKALAQKQARIIGRFCEEAVRAALALPDRELPVYPKKKRPGKDEQNEKRVGILKRLRETLSLELDMEPGFLLNNALIEMIAEADPESCEALSVLAPVRQWQIQALGDRIFSALGHTGNKNRNRAG